MIYLLMFGVTALLGWLIQQPVCARNRWARVLLSLLIVLIPSILGGIRSRYLGTDNITYAKQFEAAVTTSAKTILTAGNTEMMSRILRLILSRITGDYHWYFFVIEVITMAFVYAGIYHFRDRVPLWQSLTVYMFCFYCLRIHLIWQGAALAVVLFAFRFVPARKPVPYFLLVGLAMLFHVSALVAALIYPLYHMIAMPDDSLHPVRLDPAVMVVCVMALVLALPTVANGLIQLKILPKSYGTYLPQRFRLDREETVTRLPLLLIATLLYRDLSRKEPMYRFFYVMLWAEFLLSQYGSGNSHSWRLSLYFGFFNILSIPCLLKVIRQDPPDGVLGKGLMLCYLVVFWVYWFVLNNRGFAYPVYPFITDLL